MPKSEAGQWVNRWWLVLIHGLLLIGLSYLLLSHTDVIFKPLGWIISLLAILTGTMAILIRFLAGKQEKSPMDLWWGMIMCALGLFFLNKLHSNEYWIQWLLMLYMVMNALNLFLVSSQLSPQYRIWVYSLPLIFYTLGIVYMFLTNGWLFDWAPLLFSGLQFFLNGILLAVVAFGIRRLQNEYNRKLYELRNQPKESSPA
jgi:uncharacterized membrane protein HdeD (DUF308 family)